VSRKLSDLEAHLKTRLIQRSSRRLALTDAGRDYLVACRGILEQVDEAERTASGEYANVRGELVISAPIVFGRLHVSPIVAAFLDGQPEVDVRLVLGDRIVNLLEDHIDLALRIGDLPDSSLVATQVGAIRRVLCASPHYLAKHGKPSAPQHLSAHRCVTFDSLMSENSWSFDTEHGLQRVPIRSRLAVNTADAAIAAAIAGLGITRVLSYQVAEALRDGRLLRLLPQHESAPVPASLVYPGRGRLPMKCRAFIDFAVPRFRERLADETIPGTQKTSASSKAKAKRAS
jgi:DNA-binding transcriptional LysR family regulator